MASPKPVTTEVEHDIAVSRATDAQDEEPDERWIIERLQSALLNLSVPPKEVSVRIVGAGEMTALNDEYRGKSKPTNVLAFPSNLSFDDREMLGDIVICASVVREEAMQFGMSFERRFAHMLVHGLLHLMGYDHEQDSARGEMEALETQLLMSLGYPDPYLQENTE